MHKVKAGGSCRFSAECSVTELFIITLILDERTTARGSTAIKEQRRTHQLPTSLWSVPKLRQLVNRTGFSPVTEYCILTNTRHTSPTATNRNAIEAVGAGNKRRVHHTNHTNKKLQNEKTCHIFLHISSALMSASNNAKPSTRDQGQAFGSWIDGARKDHNTLCISANGAQKILINRLYRRKTVQTTERLYR